MTTTYSALSAVSAAVFNALNVAALLALAPGGINDAIPQPAIYPLVFFEVSNAKQLGGFGSSPGHNDMPECEVRIHAFSEQQNVSQAQAILNLAIGLIYTPGALTVAGYTVCANQPMTDLQILNLGDQVVAGVVVHEEVAILRVIVQNVNA
jgi:hypothetical protein